MTVADEILELLRLGDLENFESALNDIDDESLKSWLRGCRADRFTLYDEAIEHYRYALNAPSVPHLVAASAPVRICNAYARLGDMELAVIEGEQHLLRLLTMEPHPLDEISELRSILANIYSSRGDFLRAISLTSEAPPNTETGILRAQWGWSRSVVLFQSGHIIEALDCALTAAHDLDRDAHPSFVVGLHSNIWWMRCVNGEALSDADIAQLDALRTNELVDDRRQLFDELTVVLAFARALRGEAERARGLVTELIDGNRLSEKGLIRVAIVLNAIGDKEQVLEIYRRVLGNIEPASAPFLVASVWRSLGAQYETVGDIASALECFKAAIEAAGIVTAPNTDPLCIEF